MTTDGKWLRRYRDGIRLFEEGEDVAARGELHAALFLARQMPSGDQRLACTLFALARLEHAAHRLAAADDLFEEALRVEESALGSDHPYVAIVLRAHAGLLRQVGRASDAAEAEARAERIWAAGYQSHLDEWRPTIRAA